tara:strand:+ start:1780 stop:2058 length:279 start_codon:yes stop_codon:yes gene_type:complete
MLENLLQAAIPLNLLVISIIGFFIRKTLSTIEGNQLELSKNMNKIHTDFQVSKIEFMNLKENISRANTTLERQEKKVYDIEKDVFELKLKAS